MERDADSRFAPAAQPRMEQGGIPASASMPFTIRIGAAGWTIPRLCPRRPATRWH